MILTYQPAVFDYLFHVCKSLWSLKVLTASHYCYNLLKMDSVLWLVESMLEISYKPFHFREVQKEMFPNNELDYYPAEINCPPQLIFSLKPAHHSTQVPGEKSHCGGLFWHLPPNEEGDRGPPKHSLPCPFPYEACLLCQPDSRREKAGQGAVLTGPFCPLLMEEGGRESTPNHAPYFLGQYVEI